MAPPATTRTRPRATNPTRKPKRTNYKKQKMRPKKSATPPASMSTKLEEDSLGLSISPPTCSSTTFLEVAGGDDDLGGVDHDHASATSVCSTPKAERFRIPEASTCPPAPKKPRMAPNCSIQRSTRPIAFFAPPDLELFFFYALRNIPV